MVEELAVARPGPALRGDLQGVGLVAPATTCACRSHADELVLHRDQRRSAATSGQAQVEYDKSAGDNASSSGISPSALGVVADEVLAWQVRRQLLDGCPHRAPRWPSPPDRGAPRQLPHPVEVTGSTSDYTRRHTPRPAGGRPPAVHGRALVESSSPPFSRRRRLPPRCLHGSSAGRLTRPHLARDLQRHFSPVRRTSDSG